MSNPTDTNQASELYELCKEVYKRTGWNNQELLGGWIQDQFDGPENRGTFTTRDQTETILFKLICPLYTSDYLLEKLPAEIGKKILVVITGDRPHAGYAERDNYGDYTLDENYYRNASYSNEVRKALLKLTIALSEAGELK